MEILSDVYSPEDNASSTVETVPEADTLVQPSKPALASQESDTNSILQTSSEKNPSTATPARVINEATPGTKLERVLTWVQSIPDQSLPFPSSPIEPASPDGTTETAMLVEEAPDQTAMLHSVSHQSIPPCKDPQTDTHTLPDSRDSDSNVSKQFPNEHVSCPQTVSQEHAVRQPAPDLQDSDKSNQSEEIQEPEADGPTIPAQTSAALGRNNAETNLKNTIISYPKSEEEEILEVADYFTDRNKGVGSSSSYASQADSSATTSAKEFEACNSLDSLPSSSSDFDHVERDESYATTPPKLGRTYSSSEDNFEAIDVETLSSGTIDQISITTYSSTAESLDTSSIDSPYISRAGSARGCEYSVETLSDFGDDEHDSLSASSADAGLAWRDEMFTPDPQVLRRTYSSSASERSCDGVPLALANDGEAGLSDCGQSTPRWEEHISVVWSGDSPYCPEPCYIPSNRTSVNTLESQQLEADATSAPHARSQRSMRGRTFENSVKPRKSSLLRKAARLLNHLFGGKTRRSQGRDRCETQAKKRSFASLFWSRSSRRIS